MYKEALIKIREEHNKSSDEVAKFLGIDRTTYIHYEVEDDIMPIKHLVLLASYYDVSLDYIFSSTNIFRYDDIKDANKEISGARIKEFRKEMNLSLKDFATILGCSYGTIAGYERGRYLIATPFLYTICKKYSISADYLLGKIDSPKYLK